MASPARYSISKVSLALCPSASTTCRAGKSYTAPSCRTVTPHTAPSATRTLSSRAPKRMSAPASVSSRRRLRRAMCSISVPTWGLASARMLSGAPQRTSVSIMNRWRTSRVPVFSFPSENAPAPPSPNWTLLSVSSAPPLQKRSTSSCRCSTGRPRSNTIGRAPQRASTSAANRPAGPAPTTMGGISGAVTAAGRAYVSGA